MQVPERDLTNKARNCKITSAKRRDLEAPYLWLALSLAMTIGAPAYGPGYPEAYPARGGVGGDFSYHEVNIKPQALNP